VEKKTPNTKVEADAMDLIKRCDNFQRYTKDQTQPLLLTQLIQLAWPSQRWGMNIIGSMPPAQGNLKSDVVTMDYFLK
jgi:hypothetical protein